MDRPSTIVISFNNVRKMTSISLSRFSRWMQRTAVTPQHSIAGLAGPEGITEEKRKALKRDRGRLYWRLFKGTKYSFMY